MSFRWDNRYLTLPEVFFKKHSPEPSSNPQVVVWNDALMKALGVNPVITQELLELLSGNVPVNLVPYAQAYAGHQFGHFTMLGDGRALHLGEHITPQGQRFDVQLKGAGRTAYSRGGDGRATLRSMLREYLISEAMHGLGIDTSRSFGTGHAKSYKGGHVRVRSVFLRNFGFGGLVSLHLEAPLSVDQQFLVARGRFVHGGHAPTN